MNLALEEIKSKTPDRIENSLSSLETDEKFYSELFIIMVGQI